MIIIMIIITMLVTKNTNNFKNVYKNIKTIRASTNIPTIGKLTILTMLKV